jgi:aflatoxin B1 aldehyde reductase
LGNQVRRPARLPYHNADPLRLDTLGARVHTAEDAGKIVDAFTEHGHNEIDTARVYGNGTTEQLLAELGWQKRGIVMDTKLYPNAGTAMSKDDAYTHTPKDVRRGLLNSLKALGTEKIDMFYLHGPDRRNSFEDTLREVNALCKEGYFKRFGLSNYMSWEVARICEICERNGWIKPTVYQGIYHALQRRVEDELMPCLRYYGIALYAFQPLAGGFLTGRYTRNQEAFEDGSRFDPKIMQGNLHRGRYWNDLYFDALDMIKAAADKHKLTMGEVALRWLEHHSSLSSEKGDAIIVGASSVKHLEENLADVEKGPLPQDVIDSLDEAWLKAKAVAPKYWH